MYTKLADNRVKIELSFCEMQATQRIVESREWRQWCFSFQGDAMYITEFDSLKDVLLVLTAVFVVEEESLRENRYYVLAAGAKSTKEKIKEIWECEYE